MIYTPTQARLLALREQIVFFETKYHRSPHSVLLLAVSKGQPLSAIFQTLEIGQKHFGENYLQEALLKIQAIPSQYGCIWHYIGPIQRNKTRGIATHFDWVHSVDNTVIATRLNDQRPTHLPPLNICLAVNISHEATKSGVLPNELLPLIEHCSQLPRLHIRGLMVIPEPSQDIIKQRQIFNEIKTLKESLINKGYPLDTLSMGMSDDIEAAIAEQSTIVRVGRSIFGERADPKLKNHF